MAYLPDPWVIEVGLEHADMDWEQPISMEMYLSLCRQVFVDAATIRLATIASESDRCVEYYKEYEKERTRKAEVAKQKAIEEEAEAELMRLKETNPIEYGKRMKAKRDAEQIAKEKRKEDLKQKKKEKKLQDKKEWELIQREQRQLNRLAETDPEEFTRRTAELEVKIRKYQEKMEIQEQQKAHAKKKKANENS